MRKVGSFLVLLGFVAGLALAALLFQWDSSERAAALATPTGEASAPATSGAAATGGGAGPAAQAGANNAAGGAIQNGKVVYNKFCNGCHPNGKAGVGPAITGVSEANIKTVIRQGKGGMPAFGEGQISDDQLAELVAYVKSIK